MNFSYKQFGEYNVVIREDRETETILSVKNNTFGNNYIREFKLLNTPREFYIKTRGTEECRRMNPNHSSVNKNPLKKDAQWLSVYLKYDRDFDRDKNGEDIKHTFTYPLGYSTLIWDGEKTTPIDKFGVNVILNSHEKSVNIQVPTYTKSEMKDVLSMSLRDAINDLKEKRVQSELIETKLKQLTEDVSWLLKNTSINVNGLSLEHLNRIGDIKKRIQF